ncbi:hypothetical protein APUTEX25_004070, partial [Auxenochlorella protothecoides]
SHVMWPFKGEKPLTEEQQARLRRKCGLMVVTLRNCLAANKTRPGTCNNLDTQVVHCYAEVLDPALAAAHEDCFTKAVNSRRDPPYTACQGQAQAMRSALAKRKLYPFADR